MNTVAQPNSYGDVPIGTFLDARYRIVGLLGRGAVGNVYRAVEVATGRSMAVKMLRAKLGEQRELRDRLEREAFATAYAEHPNCVRIEEMGTAADGRLYLVMEQLDGTSLAQVLVDQQRLGLSRALHITAHVLRGLAHAHGAGVLHRDLKPENVFLARADGDDDFAKILDFGLAKLVGAAGVGQAPLTRAGFVMGTPTYMAPEMFTGETELDARGDLYSLSVMLYEMIAGRPPFVADSAPAVFKMHMQNEVPPFAQTAPELGVPAAVEAVVRRGLAKQPEARFATAAEYLSAVETLLADPLIQAQSERRQSQAGQPKRRPEAAEPPSAGAADPEVLAELAELAALTAPSSLPPLPQLRTDPSQPGLPAAPVTWRPGALSARARRVLAFGAVGIILLLVIVMAATQGSDGANSDGNGAATAPSHREFIEAWRAAGLEPGGFGPIEGDRLGGGACVSGAIRGVEVTLCNYEDEELAQRARKRARKLIGSSPGEAVAAGRSLLVAADRMRANSADDTIAAVTAAFEDTARRE